MPKFSINGLLEAVSAVTLGDKSVGQDQNPHSSEDSEIGRRIYFDNDAEESTKNKSSRHQYRYENLDGQNTIRLLGVEKLSDKDPENSLPFQFYLLHVSLDSPPPYETVSYVWGKDPPSVDLNLIGGTTIQITPTLDDAIYRLAQECSTGYLWIDQICINQDDILERNAQVKIMGRIYEDAERVIIWLGRTSLPFSDGLSRVCDLVAGKFEDNKETAEAIYNANSIFSENLRRDVNAYDGYSMHRHPLYQLHCYVGSEWFTRVWIFQEAVLSKKCIVALGSGTMSLECLYFFGLHIKEAEEEDDCMWPNCPDPMRAEYFTGLRMLRIIYRTRLDWHELQQRKSNYHFEHLISEVCPKTNASDPLDRVYAFLGLNRDKSLEIEPDYTADRNGVFVALTKAVINARHSLVIFELLVRDDEAMRDHVPEYRGRVESHMGESIEKDELFRPKFGDDEGRRGGRSKDLATRDLTDMNIASNEFLRLEVESRTVNRSSPSWVPNFSHRQLVLPFARSKAEKSQMYPHVTEWDSPTALTARGKVVDSVMMRLEPTVGETDETQFDFLNYLQMATFAWEASRRGVLRPTRESVLSAFMANGHVEDEDDIADALSEMMAVKGLWEMLSYFTWNITGTANPREDAELDSDDEYDEDDERKVYTFRVDGRVDRIEAKELGKALVLMESINRVAGGRNLCVSSEGRLVLGANLASGDNLCILHGCSNPVALRPAGDDTYFVQGVCFVEGWMDPWSSGKIFWKEEEFSVFQLI